ncbi:MAG: ABC transporter permease [Thermoanaerobaculia bacterium]|nr:ABC transporter permease [Thermoanaerobaculia bacterium]
MNGQRLWAVARKETLHIVRDPRSLTMGIAIPMLLLILFGFALTLDVDDVPLVVWDQSRTPASRELISGFQGSPYFSLQAFVGGYDEIERAIDHSEALMAVVIPVDLGKTSSSGLPPSVQILVDGSDSNTAALAIGYGESVVRRWSQTVVLERFRRLGGQTVALPLEVRPRIWFNAEMESKNYIIPGLIAVIMMVIAALLTSLTVAREWETGTMEQLISTPLKGHELILGKFLPYFGIGLLDVLLAVLMGAFVFEVPLRGSLWLLFAMAAIFLTGALALGLVISIVTKGQLLASQLAMVLTFLPAFLLSGFMYDIGNMPRPIQVITHLIPARYFVTLLKGIYLKGVGLETLASEALLLAVFSVVMLLVSTLKFRKNLE